MSSHTMTTWQWLPRPRDEVFSFFSDARNLQRITPDFLHFQLLTPGPISMRPGELIDYRLTLRGVPLRWRTKITTWEPPMRFSDIQLRGPYAEWSHTHTFEEENGGTLVRDAVRYRLWGPSLVTRNSQQGPCRPGHKAHLRVQAQSARRDLRRENQARAGDVTFA